jgi:hypothetical protein
MDTPTTGPAQAPTPDEAANNTGAELTGTQTDRPAPPATTTPPQVSMSQADLDRLISRRLADDRKARDAEAQKKAQEEAGNFKALYEALQAEHTTLTATAEARVQELETQVQNLAALVNQQIDAAVKTWPKVITLTDPGSDNVSARQAWFAKVAPEVGTLQTSAPPPGPHTPRPSANGAAPPSELQHRISATW